MRILATIISALVLAGAPPLAAAQTEPLAPGKPAGLDQAQMNNHQLFIYITLGGTVAVVAAGLLMLKKSKTGTAATPTTTS